MLERVIAGRVDDLTLRWLVEAFRKFDEAEGRLPLERCLRLPTAAQRRLNERNFWLRTLGELVHEPRPVARAHAVARRLCAFMTRGPWRQWQATAAPPPNATDLEQALYFAARAIGSGAIPQWRQVARVIGSCQTNVVC